jgi:hypothetical protein
MVYIHNSFLFVIIIIVAGYMKSLDKLVLNEEECDKIQQQLSQYMLGQGAFGTNHALRDRGNLSSLACGTFMVVAPHSSNVWQHWCFHKW